MNKIMGQMKIVVLAVNYQTDFVALRFMRNLSRVSREADVDIVLVDNTTNRDPTSFFEEVETDSEIKTLCY